MASFNFWDDFREFLKEYKIMSVAIGFIMGVATNELVKSFVDNIFMPLLDPLINDGTWETATWSIGPFNIGWGAFLSELLHWLIIALVVFLVIKKLVRDSIIFREKEKKKKKEQKKAKKNK